MLTSKPVGILGEEPDRIGRKRSEGGIIPFVRDGNWTFSLWCARMLLGSLWKTVPFRNRPRNVVLICTVRPGVDTGPNPHRGWKRKGHSMSSIPFTLSTQGLILIGDGNSLATKETTDPAPSTQGLILIGDGNWNTIEGLTTWPIVDTGPNPHRGWKRECSASCRASIARRHRG